MPLTSLMCREVWFTSPKRDVRIDLPQPAPVSCVKEYVSKLYFDLLPDSGFAPRIFVLYRDEILRFDLRDEIFLLPKEQTEKNGEET